MGIGKEFNESFMEEFQKRLPETQNNVILILFSIRWDTEEQAFEILLFYLITIIKKNQSRNPCFLDLADSEGVILNWEKKDELGQNEKGGRE